MITFRKVVEEYWRGKPGGGVGAGGQGVGSSRRGALGGHPGVGGFGVIGSSRSAPASRNQESKLLRAD